MRKEDTMKTEIEIGDSVRLHEGHIYQSAIGNKAFQVPPSATEHTWKVVGIGSELIALMAPNIQTSHGIAGMQIHRSAVSDIVPQGFVRGNYVFADDVVVLVSGDGDTDFTFAGTVVENRRMIDRVGHHQKCWVRDRFKRIDHIKVVLAYNAAQVV